MGGSKEFSAEQYCQNSQSLSRKKGFFNNTVTKMGINKKVSHVCQQDFLNNVFIPP